MSDWFDEGGSGKALDLEALWDSEVPDAIRRLVGTGALVSMGLTSDGGAFGLTVTVDGRWRREYFRDAEEVLSWAAEALPAVRAAAEARAASAVRGRGGRRSRGL